MLSKDYQRLKQLFGDQINKTGQILLVGRALPTLFENHYSKEIKISNSTNNALSVKK